MVLLLLMVLSVGMILHADVTVGTYTTGNCYPFLCNDTGTNTGPSIQFQQGYSAAAFSGQITITNLEFYYASQFGGSPNVLGGTYNFFLGYVNTNQAWNNLSTTLTANQGADFHQVASLTFPPFSGPTTDPVWSVPISPFTYIPGNGDLLLEVDVTNQDNVPNGSGNGYLEADNSFAVTNRAYCLTGIGCFSNDGVGLVTTFSTSQSTTPEPSTLIMFGSGVLGLAGLLRRKFMV